MHFLFMEKEENAGDQHLLLFSKCFLIIQRQITSFDQYLSSSASVYSVDKSNIVTFGNT